MAAMRGCGNSPSLFALWPPTAPQLPSSATAFVQQLAENEDVCVGIDNLELPVAVVLFRERHPNRPGWLHLLVERVDAAHANVGIPVAFRSAARNVWAFISVDT